MVDFYHASSLPFETRVIMTLKQGQKHGGDIRGKRSAGLLVAEGVKSGDYWNGTIFDLRTDDNPEPLKEIERLFQIAQGYQFMNKGDREFYENNNEQRALEHYRIATQLIPENMEAKFWYAKLLWDMGDLNQAKVQMDELVNSGDKWREYWKRVVGEDF